MLTQFGLKNLHFNKPPGDSDSDAGVNRLHF